MCTEALGENESILNRPLAFSGKICRHQDPFDCYCELIASNRSRGLGTECRLVFQSLFL